MKIIELQEGMFCTRDNWGHRGSRGLCIGIYGGKLSYFDNGEFSSVVRLGTGRYSTSSAFNYDDFRLCTINGRCPHPDDFNKQTAKLMPKENTMKYEDVKVIVITNKDKNPIPFPNEEDALDWIADVLEDNPRTNFTMLKPYQEIKPKRMSLKDLITKII
jgi:hypothetical protein